MSGRPCPTMGEHTGVRQKHMCIQSTQKQTYHAVHGVVNRLGELGFEVGILAPHGHLGGILDGVEGDHVGVRRVRVEHVTHHGATKGSPAHGVGGSLMLGLLGGWLTLLADLAWVLLLQAMHTCKE